MKYTKLSRNRKSANAGLVVCLGGLLATLCSGCDVQSTDEEDVGVQLWTNGPFWATCNLGATKPEEFGCYFYWGHVEGYIGERPFRYFDDWPIRNKVNDEILTPAGNLKLQFDAARQNLGGTWCMPTIDDFEALIRNCSTQWTSLNGVSGLLVRGLGAYAAKSIFLPAAGVDKSPLSRPNDVGGYWSSTPDEGKGVGREAKELYFDSSHVTTRHGYDLGVKYGRTIRPLRQDVKPQED